MGVDGLPLGEFLVPQLATIRQSVKPMALRSVQLLLDAIEDLYKEYGYYQNGMCSFTFEGASGMETMKNLMENLRKAPPAEIAGMKVVKAVDYKAEGTGLPKANVLEYRLEGGAKFMVRPSGTEPKIKTYLSAVGKTEAEATAINARLAEAAKEMMKD